MCLVMEYPAVDLDVDEAHPNGNTGVMPLRDTECRLRYEGSMRKYPSMGIYNLKPIIQPALLALLLQVSVAFPCVAT